MKSAEKAAEVCRKLGLPVDETENGVAYQIILAALRERERATRRVCAEALLHLPREWGAINMNSARAACMNAKVE